MHQKLVLDLSLILVNNPKQHTRNSYKKDILKEDYQKAFKKLILFALSNPGPSYGQCYQKQKGSGTSELLLFRF